MLAKKTDPEASGKRTSEFLLNLLVVVLIFVSANAGLDSESWVAQVVGYAIAALASLGYTGGRVIVKKAIIQNGGRK